MFEKIRRARDCDARLALGFLRDGRSLGGGEHRDARERRDLLAILLKGRANPRREHRRARRALHADRERLQKRVRLNAALHKYRVNNAGSAGAERILGAPLPAVGDVRRGTATGDSTGTFSGNNIYGALRK